MKLASIETIKSLKKHPNADKLEIAQVLGWQSVVQSGIHKEGDKVVFIVIDTIVPRYHWSDFLADKNNPDKPIRLKMVKLRGEHSAGIVVPLSQFNDSFAALEVGSDVTEILGVKKYIKELPANLAGENVGDFPTHIVSKTDEDNGLSDLDLVSEVIRAGNLSVTQKLDGSSITIIIENGCITQVCSRNLSKKETDKSAFWNAAKKLRVLNGLTCTVQGELMGPGIQGNQLKLQEPEIFVFQVKKQTGEYMNYQEMKGFCNIELGCKVVPLVCEANLVGNTIDEVITQLQNISDQQTLSCGAPAEGIVVRPHSYRSFTNSRRPQGFKIINRNYKDT